MGGWLFRTLFRLAPLPKSAIGRLLHLIAACGAILYAPVSAYNAWERVEVYDEMKVSGVETTAQIISAGLKAGFKNTHLYVDIGWTDRRGQPRMFKDVRISSAFHDRIAPQDRLVVRQTSIRYLETRPDVEPVLLVEPKERPSLGFGIGIGVFLFLCGVITLARVLTSFASGSRPARAAS